MGKQASILSGVALLSGPSENALGRPENDSFRIWKKPFRQNAEDRLFLLLDSLMTLPEFLAKRLLAAFPSASIP
jgi:hypothetical protein